MADDKINVLLVGAGKMGLAMLKGWLAADSNDQYRFSVLDPYPSDDLRKLRNQTTGDKLDIVSWDVPPANKQDFAVMAVKPQQFAEVAHSVHFDSDFGSDLYISVAAGITSNNMEQIFRGAKLVRAMPNLPAQIGAGMSGAFSPRSLSDLEKHHVEFLLGSTGEFRWVDDEAQIDAVTAISGSGPAYVFLLAEALAKVAEQIGLDARNVETFANQTIIGAAELLKQSEEGAATLRRNVTSPGGTTEAALKVLMREGNGLEELLLEAVQAAKKRSEELSK